MDISALKSIVGYQEPVSFREFVTSPEYCGNVDLYESWLKEGESTSKSVSEVILTGSLGNGKSYYAAYLLAYRVYLLFLNGTPQQQLGLAADTDVFVFYFSVSITTAKRSGYNYIYTIFSDANWFKEHAPINTNLKSSIEFVDKHFTIAYASSEGHQIGLNVWGFILDEANFRGPGVGTGVAEQYEEVTQLYEQLLDRQLSRYARPDGSVESLAILISSASYQSSFVERRISAVRGSEYARVCVSRAYDTKPHMFSKERFEVFIGSGTVQPAIITSEEHKLKLLQQAGVLGTGEEDKFVEKVPVNLRPAFERNIVLAIQNHCGRSTNISTSFMSNMKYLYDSYVSELEIPPILQSFTLEASTGDDTQLIEYLLPDNLRNTDFPHSIFIDASVQHDTASVVCFRYDGTKDGVDYHTKVFSLKLIPPAFPNQTKLSKIQRFIIDISAYINLVAVGSDQFQCMAKETLIPTVRGIIPISEVEIGDYVFSQSGVPVRVKNKFEYVAPVIKLVTNQRNVIRCTANHRFIETYRSNCILKQRERLSCEFLNRRVIHTPKLAIEGSYQKFGECVLDEKLALILGWLVGDGGISNGVPYLVFAKSETYLSTILDGVTDLVYGHDSLDKKRTSYRYTVSRKCKVGKALKYELGYSYNAILKKVPKQIFSSPKSVVSAFLKGLYSSDGSCTLEQVSLSSVSLELLNGVRVLLRLYFGVHSTICKSDRGYKGDFGERPCYHLRTFGPIDGFREIGFLQDHKNSILAKMNVVGKGYLEKVISIEDDGIDEVFDLEVEDSIHLYYTDILLSHNSSQLRQEINSELGLEDIRISIDSSDIPHLHWQRGLVEGRIKQVREELLEKEVKEAIHDWQKHRVLKAKNSTDDCLQGNCGAFYLSDTIGKSFGSLEGLYGPVNIVGASAFKKFLKYSNYKTN